MAHGTAPDIVDDERHHRFVARVDGHEAELVYRRDAGVVVLVHTGVPDELGGRGLGGRLVAAAVDDARRRGLTVAVECPFARSWIERHPDQVDGVDILGADRGGSV